MKRKNYNSIVNVENDCEDQACSPINYCVKWPCCKEKKQLIKNEKGYRTCPICKGSYGK